MPSEALTPQEINDNDKYDSRTEIWTKFLKKVENDQADSECEFNAWETGYRVQKVDVRSKPQVCSRRDDVESGLYRLSTYLVSGDCETEALGVRVADGSSTAHQTTSLETACASMRSG